MARDIVVVDPLFAERLRAFRTQRGLTLRALAALANYSHTHIWELENGRKQPSASVARRLDDVLKLDGSLTALISSTLIPSKPATATLDPDDIDRLRTVAARPRSVDLAVVESLRTVLAQQRRIEDAVGSATMVAPVAAQLLIVERLVGDARGGVRTSVLDVGSQWAQFAGWLNANCRQPAEARRWYGTALEWAAEINYTDMIATALSMRGHLAWLAGEIGPVIGLSAAAGGLRASAGVRALAAQQEARGYALSGDGATTDRRLDAAWELATAATEHPDAEPPWIYFHSLDYLTMQRGLAYRYLGRLDLATEWLTTGLAAMRSEMRRSEWVGTYVYHLGLTHLANGHLDGTMDAIDEIRTAATDLGSARLAALGDRLAAKVATVS